MSEIKNSDRQRLNDGKRMLIRWTISFDIFLYNIHSPLFRRWVLLRTVDSDRLTGWLTDWLAGFRSFIILNKTIDAKWIVFQVESEPPSSWKKKCLMAAHTHLLRVPQSFDEERNKRAAKPSQAEQNRILKIEKMAWSILRSSEAFRYLWLLIKLKIRPSSLESQWANEWVSLYLKCRSSRAVTSMLHKPCWCCVCVCVVLVGLYQQHLSSET